MKPLIAILLLSVNIACYAADRINETTEEARQRHQAEQYDAYKRHNYNEPLGGYNERLGDTSPRQNPYTPSSTNSDYSSGTWQDRAKR